MDKDFKQVSVWAKESNVTWLDLVEGIIQALKQHRSLYSPMTIFSKLTPHSGETKLEFSERIRDTFYRLPVQRRASLGVMEAFKDILQEHLPLVLLNLGDKVSSLSTASPVEENFLVIRLLDRHSKTENEDQNSNGSIPIVAYPRFDDRTVNIAKESNDKCYKCHRNGHWAINCPQESTSYTPNIPNAKSSTSFLKGQSSEKSQAFQDADSKFKNTFKRVIDRHAHARANRSKPGKFYSNQSRFGEHNYAHQADEESRSQDEKGPADKLEHADSDEELRDILADLMFEGDLE
ncbi:hypothetical protein K3495_g9762 [Podosphaera aphanis]|nr:hypothetical protein K3495_g9762 [Podosphaera aphanis]